MAIRSIEDKLRRQKRNLIILLVLIGITTIVFIYLYANKSKTKLSDLQTRNSVVITYSTLKNDDTSYLIQTHKTIFYNGLKIKEVTDSDTVPNPGNHMEQSGSIWLDVPNEYEFFITIK
ncbi:MAG TPA: hypothetical protein VEC12_02495 [Bacteroidia bacterium]|nr:hypothetical protein [Bacteroidia bacterium]